MISHPRHYIAHCERCDRATDHIDSEDYLGCTECAATPRDIDHWLKLWNAAPITDERPTRPAPLIDMSGEIE